MVFWAFVIPAGSI